MDPVDVVAVVSAYAVERAQVALGLARQTGRVLIPAARLAVSSDPVDEAVALVPWVDAPAGAVLELPGATPVTELIGALADPTGPATLTGVVSVVHAGRLLEDLRRETYVRRATLAWNRHLGPEEFLAHAMLTATQIEYASLVVVTHWDEVPSADLVTLLALIAALSPRAQVELGRDDPLAWEPGERYLPGQDRAGWVQVLNGEHAPQRTDPRVTALRYENIRPLHPERLMAFLDEQVEPHALGIVVRSAGFCRLATRPHVVAQWDHVGRVIGLEPLGRDDALTDDDELLAIGQDLAIIGLDLDVDGLRAALDAVALDDDELAAGPPAWRSFADPFPAWHTSSDHTD